MGLKSHNQVSKTLTVTELTEHQRKKLVPAGEMLDITVPVILVNKATELVIIQKLYQLGEHIFVFVHLAVNLFGCKITNSNRRALKATRKRLYFSDFKERLVHFNGTVMFFVKNNHFISNTLLQDEKFFYLLGVIAYNHHIDISNSRHTVQMRDISFPQNLPYIFYHTIF